MVYGMTWEQYWYGDPWMAKAYRQAYLMKRKVENENMWIQGAYIFNAVTNAIATTFGKKRVDYLKKPLDIFPKTEAEKAEEVRSERKKLIEFLNGFRKKMKNQSMGVDQNGKP